ncbi:MAG: hypothetical protein OXM57_03755 [bacterium]|nr:hypothetical protein [bacterium]MDE0351785.1 hypothetical protein [bacterium]
MDHAVLYQHSQASPPAMWVLVCCWWIPVALLSGVNDPGRTPYLLGLFPVLSLIYVGFLRLTVTVSGAEILLAYTFGRPRRRIDRGRVISAVPERIPLWYGWGIRRTPRGWMWNVWGRDAVRVTLTDREFLIGTDDPDGLVAALTPR